MPDQRGRDRPAEGARWNTWAPAIDVPPPLAEPPLPRAPAPPPGPPPTGINVPLTLADFQEHWEALAHHAAFDEDWPEFIELWQLSQEIDLTFASLEKARATSDSPELATTPFYLHGFDALIRFLELIKPADFDKEIRKGIEDVRNSVTAVLTDKEYDRVRERQAVYLTRSQLLDIDKIANSEEGRAAILNDLLRERLDFFSALGEAFEFSEKTKIQPEAGSGFQPTLFQIEKLYKAQPVYASIVFDVELTEYRDLFRQGLVSPLNQSDEALDRLKDYSPFRTVWLARVGSLSKILIPLSLHDFRSHWDELKSYAIVTGHESFGDVLAEMDHPDTSIKGRKFLSALQREQLRVAHLTYLEHDQIEAFYKKGWRLTATSDTWLSLHSQGLVSDDYLSKDDVIKFTSIPFFKALYDRKFNTELIAENYRKAAEGRNAIIGMFVVALIATLIGFGIWHFFFKDTGSATAVKDASSQAASAASSPTLQASSPSATTAAAPISVAASEPARFIQSKEDLLPRHTPIGVETLEQRASEAEDGINQVMIVASGGDLEAIAEAERTRFSELTSKDPTGDFNSAMRKHRQALLKYRSDLSEALRLQWEAEAEYPLGREIIGNLGYYLALTGNMAEARNAFLASLGIQADGATTGRHADWQLLAAISAKNNPSYSLNAYRVALSISQNWDGYCKSLLTQGRDFGLATKQVISRIFGEIRERGEGRDLPNCAIPPAFN